MRLLLHEVLKRALPRRERAFIAEWGDKGRALIRLGFPAVNKLPLDRVHLYNDHVAPVFATPGMGAILKRDLARLDVEREAFLSRLGRMGLYGKDAESVRAAGLLIKVCGWEHRGDSAPVASASPVRKSFMLPRA